MKKEKLSFKSIKNVLSRAEMKKIMAGSGGCGNGCYVQLGCDQQHQCPNCVGAGPGPGTCQG